MIQPECAAVHEPHAHAMRGIVDCTLGQERHVRIETRGTSVPHDGARQAASAASTCSACPDDAARKPRTYYTVDSGVHGRIWEN
jgi:hypothetical protein